MLRQGVILLGMLAGLLALTPVAAVSQTSSEDPQVIFVPGILGSKIQVDGKPVWGDGKFNEAALELVPGRAVSTGELSALDVDVLVGTFKRTVYGKLFTALQEDLTSVNNVTLFSYDWRTSNKLSAEKLAAEICRLSEADRPIVLAAHSMGGLVVKHWLRNAYGKPCPSGHTPSIRSLIFAATPHLGSPQAVLSLLDDISLDANFNWMVGGGLNRYGYTFDSIYELLPAAHAYRGHQSSSTMCMAARPRERQGVVSAFYKNPVSGETSLLDLFSAEVYERLGIYERFPDLGARSDRQQYLQAKLDAARDNICDLVGLTIPAELTKSTFYLGGYSEGGDGYREANTTTLLTISPNRKLLTRVDFEIADTSSYYLQIDKGVGDGTVPISAALDGYEEFRVADVQLRLTNAGHESILDSSMFRQLVDWQQRPDDGPVFSIGTLSFTDLVGSIGRVRAQWAGAGSETLAAEIASAPGWNAAAAELRYDTAKQQRDPVLFEAAAADSALPFKLQAWALQNSAFYYAQANQRADAQRVIDKALALLEKSGDDEVKAALVPKLYTTSGWVNMTAGMLDDAKNAYQMALDVSPSARAKQGLETIGGLDFVAPPSQFDYITAFESKG